MACTYSYSHFDIRSIGAILIISWQVWKFKRLQGPELAVVAMGGLAVAKGQYLLAVAQSQGHSFNLFFLIEIHTKFQRKKTHN